MYKKILVPLDGTKQAESILPQVQSVANHYGAAVILLKVENPSLLLGLDEVIDMAHYKRTRQKQRQSSIAYLTGIAAVLSAAKIDTKAIVEQGHVVKTVIDVAWREGADLVALTKSNDSARSPSYYGGTTAILMQRIDRPLLINNSLKKSA